MRVAGAACGRAAGFAGGRFADGTSGTPSLAQKRAPERLKKPQRGQITPPAGAAGAGRAGTAIRGDETGAWREVAAPTGAGSASRHARRASRNSTAVWKRSAALSFIARM